MVCLALGCAKRPASDPVAACLSAVDARSAAGTSMCENAWQRTRDIRAAVGGAQLALHFEDADALRRFADGVPQTVEGARVLHFWGQLQLQRGELEGAAATFRRTLTIRVDRDAARATNTALLLIQIIRNSQPAEESVALARTAWEQAHRSGVADAIAYAATTLVEIFVELGELRTAQVIAAQIDPGEAYGPMRDLVQGRLHAARGEHELASALFERASKARAGGHAYVRLDALLERIPPLLELGRTQEARATIDRAAEIARRDGVSVDVECRLASAEAGVSLAEGNVQRAREAVERGLATSSRDAARVRLLNVRGDLAMQSGDAAGAEQAWREAADLLETWRASIPTVQLRAGLIAQHRRALEAWLDSAAARGDVAAALEVSRRLLGRSLLDRIRQREANETTVDASIRDVEKRLALRRELGVTLGSMRDLRVAPYDVFMFMVGARNVWTLRRSAGEWSIAHAGDREHVATLVEAYLKDLDDARAAERLGATMFPRASLPGSGAPIAVVLDGELAEVPLAGLRIGTQYLVELAPIMELVAPDLLFVPVPERTWGPAIAVGDPHGDLPGAAREAHDVAKLLGARAYVGAEATSRRVASGHGARVLHLATHASVADGRAQLVLHGGVLSSIEIVNRKLAPRVAVVATCRSQVDDDPATSLVAAFLASGSLGVVGVKRSLDDRASTALVEVFYRAGGAEDPIAGLAAAQRSAIAARQPPRTWATLSFFGVGGWLKPRR